MPKPKKIQRTGEKTNDVNKSPFEIRKDLMSAVYKRRNGTGTILVRGIKDDDGSSDEEEDEDEEEEVDPNTYTQEQINNLRSIIVNEELDSALDNMEKLILGSQHGDGVMMFSTGFSYEVLEAFERCKNAHRRERSWSGKFNILFGFTHALRTYDVWMQDHEAGWGGEKMVAGLARLWKNVLEKSDEELGIDAEFTRPGVICFLEGFKKDVERIDTGDDPEMKFKFC